MTRLTLILLLLVPTMSMGQDYLVEIWPGFSSSTMNVTFGSIQSSYQLECKEKSIGPQVRVMFSLTQKYSLGLFASSAAGTSGTVQERSGISIADAATVKLQQQQFGLEFQGGSLRHRRFGVYYRLAAAYTMLKNQYSYSDSFNSQRYSNQLPTEGKGMMYSAGGGLWVRFGHRVYLNFIEVNYSMGSKSIYKGYESNTPATLSYGSSLFFRFGRKK